MKGSQVCGGKDSIRHCEAPHPAFLSTPTRPTVREGPGKRNTTEKRKLRVCRAEPFPGAERGRGPTVLAAWFLVGSEWGLLWWEESVSYRASFLSSHFPLPFVFTHTAGVGP